jgi:hypothetical protein
LREERPLRADAISMSLKMFPEKSRISKDLSFDISSNMYTYMIRGSICFSNKHKKEKQKC